MNDEELAIAMENNYWYLLRHSEDGRVIAVPWASWNGHLRDMARSKLPTQWRVLTSGPEEEVEALNMINRS